MRNGDTAASLAWWTLLVKDVVACAIRRKGENAQDQHVAPDARSVLQSACFRHCIPFWRRVAAHCTIPSLRA